jgi:L,D-transpeptidase ErfK/SrfK
MTNRRHGITAGRSRSAALAATLLLGGCSMFAPREPVPVEPAEPPPPVIEAPLATHRFPFDPESTGVVGQLQVTYASVTRTRSRT